MQSVPSETKGAIDQLVDQAVGHHGAGRLAEAEALYRQVLEANPAHPVALHLLGVIAHQVGANDVAVDLISQAIARHPTYPDAHFNLANARYALGQLEDAASSYAEAIRLRPDYAPAYYNLGNVLKDQGRPDAAIEHYHQALSHGPGLTEAWANIGLLHQEAGRLSEAVESYNAALATGKAPPEVHNNLGNTLGAMGQHERAVTWYRNALRMRPDFTDACRNLAVALHALGDTDAAAACFRRVLVHQPDSAEASLGLGTVRQEQARGDPDRLITAARQYLAATMLKPGYVEAHYNAATALQDLGDSAGAEHHYRLTIGADPDHAGAHGNLGILLQDQGQFTQACRVYRRTLVLRPDNGEAYNNMGTALRSAGRPADAIEHYRRAMTIVQGHVSVRNNLGIALQEMGRIDEAIVVYESALARQPEHVSAYLNLGFALYEISRLDRAEATYRTALVLEPGFTAGYNNLSLVLEDQNRYDAAITGYRRALTLDPEYEGSFSNLLFCLQYHPDRSISDIFAVYQEYGDRFGARLRKQQRPHDNAREPDRTLRVGYVGANFCGHSSSHFLEPLLSHHDPAAVEVHAYAEYPRADAITERLRGQVRHWTETIGMSDTDLSDRIRADGIDILVDLAGHTNGNRMGVFARKPAPISLHWLDHGYTTGLDSVDYFLGDGHFTPEDGDRYFSETVWRLPNTVFAYRPYDGMGPVAPLPASSSETITFGTLARSVRINDRVVRVWAEILTGVASARLLIFSKNFQDRETRDRLVARFAAHGVEPGQLELGFHGAPWEILARIDIALDCFPHNSGTTLFEHAYMGTPFVTLSGATAIGRLGTSVLHSLGHPEWIASSEAEYVAIAQALAADRPALAAIRANLRQEMLDSPLMDGPAFARDVEDAYRRMWRTWCAGGRA